MAVKIPHGARHGCGSFQVDCFRTSASDHKNFEDRCLVDRHLHEGREVILLTIFPFITHKSVIRRTSLPTYRIVQICLSGVVSTFSTSVECWWTVQDR
jgi:hypothetical protein